MNTHNLKDPCLTEEESLALPMYKEVKSWLFIDNETIEKPDVVGKSDEDGPIEIITTVPKRKINLSDDSIKSKKMKGDITTEDIDSDIEILGKVKHVSYASIRSQHLLFFSYDPRGVRKSSNLPIGYCMHCRCPLPYCADIVIAPDVYEELFFLLYLYTYKTIEDTSPRGLRILFKYYYKRAVHAKMRCNQIHFPMGFDLSEGYRMPTCIKRNTFQRLLDLVQNKTKEEEENPEDLSEIELERFATKYCRSED